MKPISLSALIVATCLSLCAPIAFAHHSGAMFDLQKSVTIDGTVKEFQWTNPHSWLQVVAPAGLRQGR